MTGSRVRTRFGLAVVWTMALVVVGLAPPAAAGTTVTLKAAKGATSVPQGSRFNFTATVTNSSSESATVEVLFQLNAPSGSFVVFESRVTTVPAGGSTKLTLAVTPAQWFADQGTFETVASIAGAVSASLSFVVLAPDVLVPQFEDVTAAVGLSVTLPSPAECGEWAAGAAWADVDRDGDLDLYLPTSIGSRLWINDGSGLFSDAAVARGVDNAGHIGLGAVFADYDNDDDQDLYVVNSGPSRLFRNDGTGHFTDVTSQAGVPGPSAGSQSATWGDYDRDGRLDLYVTSYSDCDPALAFPGLGLPDKLYHQEPDGAFSDQTALLEKDPLTRSDGATDGQGFQAVWVDYDGDGDVDLYLANDKFGPNNADKNRLWRNDGPGADGLWQFTDVSGSSRAGYGMNAMGIAVGDYDRDANLDLLISDFGGNKLARNNGDGTFTDRSNASRINRSLQDAYHSAVGWGLGFYDFNNDGWEDAFVAIGSVRPRYDPVLQANELFINAKDQTFRDLSAPSGLADAETTRGAAFADFDRDGDVDLYAVNQGGTPRLYRNLQGFGNRWLEVRLKGTRSNRDACGALLSATTSSGARLVRFVLCGSSLASGSDTVAHLGLGSETLSELVVKWPSGATSTMVAPPVDQLIEMSEE